MASVTLSEVNKKYGSVTAVRSLDLGIRDGEFMVLVGPSGCGKTTALRMIAGLEDITGGEIKIGERVVNDVEPRDRDIAMVFQNYALYPHMSVYENMAFGLKLRKLPKSVIEKRVGEAASLLGIESYLQRKPKELSGGQRQRVALGRAIVREPQVFLMDEPLSNLDAKLRVQTRAELIKLHRRLKITTIYVTHDQVEAMTMGDRIAVMKDGLLQQCDTPMELYNHPANLFVAGFIGTPAMNFINAKVAKGASSNVPYIVQGDGFRVAAPPVGKEVLESWIGKDIIYGIRPVDIFDAQLVGRVDPSVDNTVDVVIDIVEPMGDVSTVFANIGANSITASVSGDSKIKDGEKVKFVLDTERGHLFDPQSELAIV
jgi:multiple sugar transport system ATP-binding protein